MKKSERNMTSLDHHLPVSHGIRVNFVWSGLWYYMTHHLYQRIRTADGPTGAGGFPGGVNFDHFAGFGPTGFMNQFFGNAFRRRASPDGFTSTFVVGDDIEVYTFVLNTIQNLLEF
jgi:hypothetical protein